MDSKPWFVYIVEAHNGKLYTGITTDVARRFEEHLSGNKGAKFFNTSSAKNLVYVEKSDNRSQASKREWAIKKLNRPEKLKLLRSSINQV